MTRIPLPGISSVCFANVASCMRRPPFCFQQSVQLRPEHNAYTLLANMQLAFDAEASAANAERALQLKPDWAEAVRVKEAAEEMLRESGSDQ